MSKLIAVALPSEFQREYVPKGFNILYTGIGKVNAAMQLTKYLTTNPHTEFVINYGTAGAAEDRYKDQLLNVSAVLERDMDLSPLGLPLYVTNANQRPLIYTSNKDPGVVCGTGDSFARPQEGYDIVDMEAYALAATAQLFNVPFYSYKYISDVDSDEDHGKEWENNVSKGAKKFLEQIFYESRYFRG